MRKLSRAEELRDISEQNTERNRAERQESRDAYDSMSEMERAYFDSDMH
ncbi:hypothetical protein HWB99_gp090 [Mycobacterium phage DrLupo]|uniref:Uncharacterized protein n=1 Tax=Mycobacterium phage DrLupo TaxID=2499037 RepID=A0A3S9UQR4_9CAUD|nr:hypothetical protein HWB99_gp090 [Mycobacterium phage DrLupo]AZS12626.1 hypothetical protein SEA_DRLUPO_90 [Mycobacterium phage DrLupo]